MLRGDETHHNAYTGTQAHTQNRTHARTQTRQHGGRTQMAGARGTRTRENAHASPPLQPITVRATPDWFKGHLNTSTRTGVVVTEPFRIVHLKLGEGSGSLEAFGLFPHWLPPVWEYWVNRFAPIKVGG